MTREEAEQYQPTPVSHMSRNERRGRLRYFTKMLKEHQKNKPKVDINEDDPEAQQQHIHELRAWATRHLILKRKINELNEFKEHNKRSHKQSS